MNTNKFMDSLFKKVDNVVYDLSTGAIGVSTDNGITTLGWDKDNDEGDRPVLEVTPIDMLGFTMPAFAQLTPIKEVVVGDMLVADNSYGWIVKASKKNIEVLNINGQQTVYRPKKISLFGVKDGVMVVRNMMSAFNNKGTNNMMLPMLMLMQKNGNNSQHDMFKIMALSSMMGGNSNGIAGMNPLMLMAMISDENPLF